mgnify:FL=1
MKPDLLITEQKLGELKKELEKLKITRPKAAAEVSRLAELGDFSENAEYQHAKGRLRGINSAMIKLEHQINHAEVIKLNDKKNVVEIGHTVTISGEKKKKTYQILGSTESKPEKGIISRHSPIGSALLGHKVGDEITVKLANKEVKYKIIMIE